MIWRVRNEKKRKKRKEKKLNGFDGNGPKGSKAKAVDDIERQKKPKNGFQKSIEWPGNWHF